MTSIKPPSLFPRASFVGFDHLFSELDFVTRSAKDTYPPHNVVKISEHEYVIEVAVAGFDMKDLSIEQDERTLNIVVINTTMNRVSIYTKVFPQKGSKELFDCPSMSK